MMPRFLSIGEAADELREQASSCRQLASRAKTVAGTRALIDIANHFEADARRIDRLGPLL